MSDKAKQREEILDIADRIDNLYWVTLPVHERKDLISILQELSQKTEQLEAERDAANYNCENVYKENLGLKAQLEAERARAERLKVELKETAENAIDDLNDWCCYIDAYYLRKHGFSGDIERYKKIIDRIDKEII